MTDISCSCRYIDDDQVDASQCLLHSDEKCHFCSRRGGVPFLMMEDGLRCSRCFEDFTLQEFQDWLLEIPQEMEILDQECERPAIVAIAQDVRAGFQRKGPTAEQHERKRSAA